MPLLPGRAVLARRPDARSRGGVLVLAVLGLPLLALSMRYSQVDSSLQVAVPAVGGISCLVAAARSVLGRRAPWALIGVAQLFNAVGNIAFTQLGTVWRIDELIGGAGQLLFLSATGLELLALVQLGGPRDLRRLWRVLVEGLFVSVVLFVVAWAHGLPGYLMAPGVRDWVAALGLVELVWDVVAVGVLLWIWTGRLHDMQPGDAPVADDEVSESEPPSGVPLLATLGLGIAVVGDVVFTVGDLLGAPEPGPVPSLSWLLSSAAFGLAPWWGPVVTAVPKVLPAGISRVTVGACVVGALAVAAAGRDRVDDWVLGGSVVAMVLAMVLLTSAMADNRRLTRRLAERERHFRTLVTDSDDVLVRLDRDNRVTYVSPAATAVLGRPTRSLVGQRWVDLVHPEDRAQAGVLLRGSHRAVQLRMLTAGAGSIWTEAVLSRADDGGAVVAVRDVDERVRLVEKLRQRAVTDLLTGLPNRRALEAALTEALSAEGSATEGAGGMPAGLLYCDLDGFKDINDTSGHAVGDDVLAVAARRLKDATGDRGLVARFGGDEFVVLVTRDATEPELNRLAQDLVAAMEDPFDVQGSLHHLGMSVGIAVHEPGRPPSELVRNADLAMYHAKEAGWGTVQIFAPGMHAEVLDRVRTRSQLRSAVGSATPELRFQPQVRLSDGVVVGVEALVGWRSADGKMLATDAVIELAETTGAIVDLGARVLRAAARQGAAWRTAGHDLRMSVNLSVRQLAWPGMVDVLDSALAESGLPATALTLEVTETMLVPQSPGALQTLERLRSTGVRLAVDDFGTGYSGLDYLRRLTVDEVKIDRSFLDGAGRRARATALLQGMVRLGHDLGLEVVGEGVETVAQARLLRRLGCHQAQGFAFSRSLSAAELEEFLALGPFDLDAATGPASSEATVVPVPRRRPPETGDPDQVSAS